jgi:RNA polymerase sigma-70 factor (ECF subfamily)
MQQRELVSRAIDGDHEAFTRLVDASVDRLYALARHILRDGDRAQDAVQDAFVSAWRDRRALRDPGAWDAWMYRLTVWACYRSAHRNRRRTLVELHVTLDRAEGALDPMVLVAERDRVQRRLGALPIDQRAVIVLRFYADLQLSDVAEILDIPIGTAKSRLHRALASLRDVMRHEVEASVDLVP